MSYLKSDYHRVQVKDWLPVFSENVQAHLALEVDVGVVDLLPAPDLGRLVGKVLVDGKVECEAAAAVHALVGVDREHKVEDVVGVREFCLHRGTQGEL